MLTTPHIHDKKLILYFHEIDIKNNKINFLSASGNQKDKATINMFVKSISFLCIFHCYLHFIL